MVNLFAVPIFFVVFRETLETSIIVSVLLAFVKKTLGPEKDAATYKKLIKQVWLGTIVGLIVCLIIGAGMIGAFYTLKKDSWSGSEDIWEGVFGLIATVIITIMGAALLRVSKLQDKWRVKLARALQSRDQPEERSKYRFLPSSRRFKRFCEKYALFMLPLITVLREGLEAIVFVGGVGVGQPASAFPIPVITGLMAGSLIGVAIYKGSRFGRIQVFLIISTCFLYLVAAGLFSKAVGYFESNKWNKEIGGDADETGAGPGSYDIRQSVWHVNCCSPELNGGGGWGIFNALFGWTNSATYGSVISYNLYWLVVIIAFLSMRYMERHGSIPFMPKMVAKDAELAEVENDSAIVTGEKSQVLTEVDEVEQSSNHHSIE